MSDQDSDSSAGFAAKLQSEPRRQFLHYSTAAAAGGALSVLHATAKAGDAEGGLLQGIIELFVRGYDSAMPPDADKKPAPKKPEEPKSFLAKSTNFSMDYAETEVKDFTSAHTRNDKARRIFEKIVPGLSNPHGSNKGEELANGICAFAKGQSDKSLPKGLLELERDTTLSKADKAEVLGTTVLLLRAEGALRMQKRMKRSRRTVLRPSYAWPKPAPKQPVLNTVGANRARNKIAKTAYHYLANNSTSPKPAAISASSLHPMCNFTTRTKSRTAKSANTRYLITVRASNRPCLSLSTRSLPKRCMPLRKTAAK